MRNPLFSIVALMIILGVSTGVVGAKEYNNSILNIRESVVINNTEMKTKTTDSFQFLSSNDNLLAYY